MGYGTHAEELDKEEDGEEELDKEKREEFGMEKDIFCLVSLSSNIYVLFCVNTFCRWSFYIGYNIFFPNFYI
jgi:hypothetical protein